jgi:hypothetical protein
MITQCRAFRIPTNHYPHKTTSILNEIPLNEYDETLSTDIFVHEITFSSNGASISVVKDAFLFFNLNPKTVQECSPKQAKKFMREQRVQDVNKIVYQSRPFILSRPQDRDAFQLTNMILYHRLENLCTKEIMDKALRCRTQARLIELGTELEVFFRRLVYNWRTWAWPVNRGREVATKDSPIPSTEANYDLPERNGVTYCGLVWESFKSALEEVSNQIFFIYHFAKHYFIKDCEGSFELIIACYFASIVTTGKWCDP